jgi:putative tricarboxylic transport membrane protein
MSSGGIKINRERLVALACMLIGILISLASRKLGLGSMSSPEAGLFPFLIGLGIILLSGISFAQGKTEEKEHPLFGVRWKNLLFVVGSLVVYAVALNWLGFPLTTFLFMSVVLKGIEPQKWSVTLLVAFSSTFFAYLIFVLWLKIEFPYGVFGW